MSKLEPQTMNSPANSKLKMSRKGVAYIVTTSILLNPWTSAHANIFTDSAEYLGKKLARIAGRTTETTAAQTETDSLISSETKPGAAGVTAAEKNAAREFNAQLAQKTKGLFTDIDALAVTGAKAKTYGRVEEIDNLVIGITNESNEGVAVAGASDVGKTQILVGLAERIRLGQVPKKLKNALVTQVNFGDALAVDVSSFARQLSKFKEMANGYLKSKGVERVEEAPIIFFIPNFLNFISEGSQKVAFDRYITSIRQTFGDRARIVIEGTEEQMDLLKESSSMVRRYYKVAVREFSAPEVFAILKEAAADEAAPVPTAVLEYINENAKRFNPEIGSPLVEISLMKNAEATKIAMRSSPESAIVNKLAAELDELRRNQKAVEALYKTKPGSDGRPRIMINPGDGKPILRDNARKLAAELPSRIENLEAELKKAQARYVERNTNLKLKIANLKTQVEQARAAGNTAELGRLTNEVANIDDLTRDDVALQVHIQNPDLPLEEILGLRGAKTIEERRAEYNQRVFGQPEMVNAMMKGATRLANGTTRDDKPLYSALVLGGTGVGKTTVAKEGAAVDFGAGRYEVVDFGRYADKTAVTGITGAGRGYEGGKQGSDIVNAALRLVRGIFNWDEIEKAIRANPEIQGALLPVLDEGRMVDSRGITAKFSQIVIWATSNAITKLTPEERALYNTLNRKERKAFLTEKLLALKNDPVNPIHFTPEFLGRFEDIIFAEDLTNETFQYIAQKEVVKFEEKVLKQRFIRVELTDRARERMAQEVTESTLGSGRDVSSVVDERVREIYESARDQGVYPDQSGIPGRPPHDLAIENGDTWVVDYDENLGYVHSTKP
jgi:ATP-dependent Clp protease ATP-binding subunit ClpA